jgi:DNA-binding response OmpR family regulator
VTDNASEQTTQRRLLEYFRTHPRKVLSREELSLNVWGFQLDSRSRVIDQTVALLRQKLPAGSRIITRHGRGYEFLPPDGEFTSPKS